MTLRAATSENLGSLLAAELALAESGVAFIYRCLDLVMERWGVTDAIAVVDDPTLGHQAFRAGRRPPEGRWATSVALESKPGLYTDPPAVDAGSELAVAFDLCRVALRLDLARYDSLHDSLTGLYNRRCFEDLLNHATERTRRYGWSFSLVLLDLDGFKNVNDKFGHEAGDEVLRSIGEEMRHTLRRGDLAARVGGDEFALLLPSTDPDFVPMLLDRLQAGVARHGGEATIGFSIGVASCPGDAEEVDALRRLADERLYDAKSKGRER